MRTVLLMRYAMFAVTAAAALSAAACGSSGNSAPAASKSSPSTSSSSAATPQAAKDRVAGIIASVSGNTVQVNQKNASATVDLTGSTKISELTPAQISDLTAGTCVTARSPKDNAAGPATAVVISTGANGSCAPPKNPRPGMVRGTVASVNGNTVAVNVVQNGATSPSNVAVDNDTKYLKRATATTSALAEGKCVVARGTKDSSGALQATQVTVSPADNGKCFGPKR